MTAAVVVMLLVVQFLALRDGGELGSTDVEVCELLVDTAIAAVVEVPAVTREALQSDVVLDNAPGAGCEWSGEGPSGAAAVALLLGPASVFASIAELSSEPVPGVPGNSVLLQTSAAWVAATETTAGTLSVVASSPVRPADVAATLLAAAAEELDRVQSAS